MSNALVPLADVERMASIFSKSGFYGQKTPDQCMALLLLANAEGVHPAIAMRDFDVINGRPAKKSEAMLRDFLAAGGRVEWHALTDALADATFSHPQGGTVRISWDMARMKQAKIANDAMYAKYPRAMLRSRVVSEGCRAVYPAATSGLYVPEEVKTFTQDAPKEKVINVEPAPAEEPEKPVSASLLKKILARFDLNGVDAQKVQAKLGKEPALATKSELEAIWDELIPEGSI